MTKLLNRHFRIADLPRFERLLLYIGPIVAIGVTAIIRSYRSGNTNSIPGIAAICVVIALIEFLVDSKYHRKSE